MAELLRHPSSKFESNNSGCMWGFLQFFDFHQRFHMRKMLAYGKHGNNKRGGGIKIAKSKQNVLLDSNTHLLESEANFQMENKVNASNKSFRKSLMRTLLYKKMSKKRDKKRRVSPSTSRLLRTISIHHLECNDYVLPDEMPSDSEASTVELSSQETDSCASSEPIFGKQHELRGTMNTTKSFMEKLIEAKEALLKQKDTDANVAIQSKDLLDKIELLNTDRELFLEVLQNPNSNLANYLQALLTSTAAPVLTKSASFPGTRLLGRTGGKSVLKEKQGSNSSINQKVKSQAVNSNTTEDGLQAAVSISGVDLGTQKSGPAAVNTTGTGSRNCKTVLNRWKDFKQRIKEVINDNRKEHRRISMDGVLHKVPFGQKLSEDLEKEKLSNITRTKFGSDGSIHGNGKFAQRSVQRSQSLTESLDRYSYLLESISVREPKRFPDKLKSIREDGDLQDLKSPKTFGRIFSNPEFRLYSFRKDVQDEASHAALLSDKPASELLAGDEAIDTYGSSGTKPVGTLENTESTESDIMPVGTLENTESTESDIIQSTIGVNAKDTVESLKQTVLIDEHDQRRTYVVSDDLLAGDSSYIPHERENEIEVDQSGKPIKPSPVCVLESHFREDPISPAKYAVSEGAELQSNLIHFEELEAVAKLQDWLGNGNFKGMELSKNYSHGEQMPKETDDINSFNAHVNNEDEAEFKYVRDVLRKSGLIGGAEGLGTWLSPYQPEVDPLLFGEAECASHELDTAIDPSFKKPLERQLLFDLINEVLLEIYESSIAQSTGISRFDHRIRPMPVGNHVLEEVWAKISWHLTTQKHQNPTLDYFVARDFAKNDEWMNLHWDIEYVGLKLECWILDDLLEESILEFGVV